MTLNKQVTFIWLLVSIALTVALSGVLWFVFKIPAFVGFLFLPFVFSGLRWFGGRRGAGSPAPNGAAGGTCPVCGRRARSAEERFCARDGAVLE